MKWEIDVDYEKGIMTVSQHTDGDTPADKQSVLAFENLVKIHNELLDGVQATIDQMIPADSPSMLRGLEYLGYLVSGTNVKDIVEEEEW